MPSPCWGRPPKRCPSRSPAKNHGWPHLVRWFSHPWETSHGHSSHCVLKLFGSFLFAVAYNCLQWRPRTVGFGVADEDLHNPLVREGMGRPKYATEDMWETLKHHSNQMFHNPGYQHIVCHCHTCWLHLFPLPPLPPSPSWQQHRHHEHLTSIIAGSCSSSWSWSWSCTSSWCSSSSWSSSYSLPFARFQHMGVAMQWTFLVFSCKSLVARLTAGAFAAARTTTNKMDRKCWCWCWFWPSQAEKTWEFVQVRTAPLLKRPNKCHHHYHHHRHDNVFIIYLFITRLIVMTLPIVTISN